MKVIMFRLKKNLIDEINSYLKPLLGRELTNKEIKTDINNLIDLYSYYVIPRKGKTFEESPYGYEFKSVNWELFKQRLILLFESEIRKHDDELDKNIWL